MTQKKPLNNIILPRGYISWSQVSLYRQNKEKYIGKYILGEDVDFENPGLKYGKIISELLEDNIESKDETENILKIVLPRYKEREKEISVNMKTKNGDIVLLGKLDTYQSGKFREYKTGTIAWTQEKANKHDQITFYALMLYLKNQKIPQSHLDWIETKNENDEISLTGKIKSFEVKKSLSDLLLFRREIEKMVVDVGRIYLKELNNI